MSERDPKTEPMQPQRSSGKLRGKGMSEKNQIENLEMAGTLVACNPSCGDAPLHGVAIGNAVRIGGILWTPVVWAQEDDPTFFKTKALVPIREKFLDYDARRDPRTPRHCSRCQKDIDPDHKARAIRVFAMTRIIHPEDSGLFLTWDTYLLGMDCARTIGMQWSIAEEG